MPIRVKICGVTTVEDARMVDASGADALGLVFYPKSPRYVDIEVARRIAAALSPFCCPVGLFVDESPETVVETARAVGLRVVQLHGHEPQATVRDIASRGLAVIKAWPIADSKDVDRLVEADRTMGDAVSAWLVDTGGQSAPGGTGRSFDWNLLRDVETRCPLILAGGLTPDTVARAIEAVRPYAVDVSGGVERSPGVKATEKVQQFVRSVRTARRLS